MVLEGGLSAPETATQPSLRLEISEDLRCHLQPPTPNWK